VPAKRANVRFFSTPAAAQEAGFRACMRCRPDAAPGAPDWSHGADIAARAMRLIADGVVDREGVPGLARALAFSERQLHRILVRELGAGPLQLARVERVRAARLLIEATQLPFVDVAASAGFSSVRQFNQTIRQFTGAAPTELRNAPAARAQAGARPDQLTVRLEYRQPLHFIGVVRQLAREAIPGVQEVRDETIRVAMSLPHGPAVAALDDGGAWIRCRLRLADLRDLSAAIQRCRRLLDLDADPEAVDSTLRLDPLLGPLVRAAPGRRVVGCVDGWELLARLIVTWGLPGAAQRAAVARLVAELGSPLPFATPGVQALFPTAAAVTEGDPERLAAQSRRAALLQSVAELVAAGELNVHAGADRDELEAGLHAVPGMPAELPLVVRMRALGDPDAFPDLDPALSARSRDWRPWRAYAAQHLWDLRSNALMPSSVSRIGPRSPLTR